MAKTWPIECDDDMLEMLAFCMQTMGGILHDDIQKGGGPGWGKRKQTVASLRSDLKVANRIIAAVMKAQMNLAVSQEVTKKKRGGKR